jgi:hypothetical protein
MKTYIIINNLAYLSRIINIVLSCKYLIIFEIILLLGKQDFHIFRDEYLVKSSWALSPDMLQPNIGLFCLKTCKSCLTQGVHYLIVLALHQELHPRTTWSFPASSHQSDKHPLLFFCDYKHPLLYTYCYIIRYNNKGKLG